MVTAAILSTKIGNFNNIHFYLFVLLKQLLHHNHEPMFHDNDTQAHHRKKDHIALAFQSQIAHDDLDRRFYYEPLLAAHPQPDQWAKPFTFLGRSCLSPLWVSSMTGGTEWAYTINHQLARVAHDFGFGMGLGSCRSLLSSNEYLRDFDVRATLGDDLPLYANLGIAQLEQLIKNNQLHLIDNLLDKLKADGLIIHVNPLQEWLQPEGDRFEHPPLETILRLLDARPTMKFIVKEVGQGMGYESLKQLLQLPLQAIDFAASGGTNFAKLELLRGTPAYRQVYEALAHVGHTAEDMVLMVNALAAELGDRMACRQIIVSGGVRDFLDGYYLLQRLQVTGVYGQASGLLRYARGGYEELYDYVQAQVQGYRLAEALLRVRI